MRVSEDRDFELQRREYIERSSRERDLLGFYTARRHPASVAGGLGDGERRGMARLWKVIAFLVVVSIVVTLVVTVLDQ